MRRPPELLPSPGGCNRNEHFNRALGWFRAAGLEDSTAETLVGTVHAPLSEELRDGLAELMEMRWGGARSELSREDWETYCRLCRPESEEYILNLEDYYGFFTYSLFQGRVT